MSPTTHPAAKPPIPSLEPAFEVAVELEAPLEFGNTSTGTRRIINITGGTISHGLDARILPGGADWQRVRDDGTMEIDGRYTALTSDDELLYFQVTGLRTGSPEVLDALRHGEPVDPSAYYFRTSITVETAAPRLAWLQRSLFIASCVREAATVRYTAYRVA